jgi:hypothetical protein
MSLPASIGGVEENNSIIRKAYSSVIIFDPKKKLSGKECGWG